MFVVWKKKDALLIEHFGTDASVLHEAIPGGGARANGAPGIRRIFRPSGRGSFAFDRDGDEMQASPDDFA
jgi:hypothetical protein